MAWVIFGSIALFAVVAFVLNEIRTAPEVDDSYEIYLREHYLRKQVEEQKGAQRPELTRESDAA